MTRHRRIFAMVVAGLTAATLGLSPQPAAAAAETTIERYEVHWDSMLEVSPHCTDEGILWSGGYQAVVTTTWTPGGAVIRSLNYEQTMTGVGVLTGSTYRLEAHYHSQFHRGGDGAEVYTFPMTYVQTSSDGGSNYIAQAVTIAVFNAQGVPVIEEPFPHGEHYFARCVG